jgi:hypothetical protein
MTEPTTTAAQRAEIAGYVDASDAVGTVTRAIFERVHQFPIEPLPTDALCDLLTGVADVDPAHRAAYALGICTVLVPLITYATQAAMQQRLKEARTKGAP